MSEIKKTKEYEMFKFREDNRASINWTHVERLAKSIKGRNLLELRPISVNGDMEVIDGQHRLLAAKKLGEGIYYRQDKELTCSDIVIMNVAKSWGVSDYLNYYCKNGYEEYQKLQQFMKTHQITVRVALNITMGCTKIGMRNFKEGKYQFKHDGVDEHLSICWETIDYIKKMNGFSQYTQNSKFWSAMLTLIRHDNFDANKWKENLKKMVERFTSKINKEDYLKLFSEVHNWRNNIKVDFTNAE